LRSSSKSRCIDELTSAVQFSKTKAFDRQLLLRAESGGAPIVLNRILPDAAVFFVVAFALPASLSSLP
jgi:hypothetical protein